MDLERLGYAVIMMLFTAYNLFLLWFVLHPQAQREQMQIVVGRTILNWLDEIGLRKRG